MSWTFHALSVLYFASDLELSFLSLSQGNARAVDAMIKADPRVVNSAKEDGFTPLHLASLNGSVEVVRVLMGARGCNCKVDARDNSGQTPIHLAAAQGFFKVSSACSSAFY